MSSIELARILVDELIRSGVREAVLAPGSRSAPLAYALRDADENRRLRLHVRIDERTAAFLALGLAKASGRCVPVVCTSGTAVANLHPALLEASHSDVPLLALTADRPLELMGSGANQTTDQARLFGPAVRWSATLVDGMSPAAIRSAVDRALSWAQGALSGDPGPAHLNLALREPLAPTDGGDGGAEAVGARPAAAEPWTARPAPAGLDAPPPGPPVPLTARTIVGAGDGPPALGALAARFAAEHGLPVVAEPSSGAWGAAIAHGPLLLGAPWLARHRPDQAIVVGRPTLSRPVRQLLGAEDVRTIGVAHTPRWVDASLALAAVHPAGSLAAAPVGTAPDGAWLRAWRAGAAAVSQLLAGRPVAWTASPDAARAVGAALPPDALLTLGSSAAVRDVELYAQPRADLLILANRGLAGIDGTISTALGAALARPDRPAYALMGDLTFLHDANGLILGPHEPGADLAIVVVNDNGGGIFATLEHGAPERAASFERVFGTAHGVDLAALCASTGAGYARAEGPDDLAAALVRPGPGRRVIEVRTDRSQVRQRHADIAAAAAAALDAV